MLKFSFIFDQLALVLLQFLQLMLEHAILLEVVVITCLQIPIICLSVLNLADKGIDLCDQLFIVGFSISFLSFQQLFIIIWGINKLLTDLLELKGKKLFLFLHRFYRVFHFSQEKIAIFNSLYLKCPQLFFRKEYCLFFDDELFFP